MFNALTGSGKDIFSKSDPAPTRFQNTDPDPDPQPCLYPCKHYIDIMMQINSYLKANSFRYESSENMTIQCSTKVCSFGKQVVEKVETEYARFEGGRFLYKLHRSPMCEYMINFILKLKHLPEKYMMNSVLENFTILQVIAIIILYGMLYMEGVK